MEVIYDLDKATGSEQGWVYCLESECGQFIKVGMTRSHSIAGRMDGVTREWPYIGMRLMWCIKDHRKERVAQRLLKKHRAKWRLPKIDREEVINPDQVSLCKTCRHTVPSNIELFNVSASDALTLICSYDIHLISYNSDRWVGSFEYRDKSKNPGIGRNKQMNLPAFVVDEIERQPNQVEFLTSLISEFIEKREKYAKEQDINAGGAS